MKKIYLLLGFIMVALFTQAQNRPSDSLYLWVDFSEDKIMIDIPDRYMHYRILPTILPSHVRVRTINTFVPNLPAKPALVSMLQRELQLSHNLQTSEQQLKYLGKIVLLLFYTNSDFNELPVEVLNTLKQLTKNETVKKEAAMVEKWVLMAEKI